MEIVILASGSAKCIYGEWIDLAALGQVQITRGSHVEPDQQGQWLADLAPVGGPLLGPFARRSQALKAEVAWLKEYWLTASASSADDVPGANNSIRAN
jgi:hypothetical protein